MLLRFSLFLKIKSMSAVQFNEFAKANKTRLIVSLVIENWQTLLDKIDMVGPYVVAVMLHIDTIGFNDRAAFNNFIQELLVLKEKHNILIIEDRKYADKPAVVSVQIDRYNVYTWADVVTAHGVCGAEPIKTIMARSLHVLLVHTMAIPGNIVAKNLAYQDLVFNMGDYLAEHNTGFTGFVSQERVRTAFDAKGQTKTHLTFAYVSNEKPNADFFIYDASSTDDVAAIAKMKKLVE